mmetsp:Transcript_10450/g.10505  ORF Transcript_10450/g.10505 Transcript_10450/m.10505 type:complete len:92 (-) Transcript_10450:297-572(-)
MEKQYIGKIEGANVYAISRVELFPFSGFNQTIRMYIEGIKKLLTYGYYFSYNIDLTSNRQRAANMRSNNFGSQQNIWDTCDKRYFWNYSIC